MDRNDQLRGYYNIEIKSRSIIKYLFYAALDIAITNAFAMSKFFPSLKKKNLKEFRVQLANELIGNYNSRKHRVVQTRVSQWEALAQCIFHLKQKKKKQMPPMFKV